MKRKKVSVTFISELLAHRGLIAQMSRRDIAARYRGSALGMAWSLITPLLMLAVYTLVFSQIFQSRWQTDGSEPTSPFTFAINLFAGLITFSLFADCANRAPTLVVDNPSYVKKVIFPIHIMAGISTISALFQACTSLGVLLVFELISYGRLPATLALLPLVWLPLVLGCLGLSWLLSALGVYLRDIGQVISVGVSMLMFLSAVFYPASALPASLQPLLKLNPLIGFLEQTRRVAVAGLAPDWPWLLTMLAIGVMFCEVSYRGFRKASRGFADVL